MNLQESIRRILREETHLDKNIQKNLRAIRQLLDTIDVDGLCEMWVEYNPEDGDYEIRSKTTVRYYDMADMAQELGYIEDTIRSWKLKTYVFSPYYVENCEDEIKFLNESEDKKHTILDQIDEHGLFDFMEMTGLTLKQIEKKTGGSLKDYYIDYIKDFVLRNSTNTNDWSGHEIDLTNDKYLQGIEIVGGTPIAEIYQFNNVGGYYKATDQYLVDVKELSNKDIEKIMFYMIVTYKEYYS